MKQKYSILEAYLNQISSATSSFYLYFPKRDCKYFPTICSHHSLKMSDREWEHLICELHLVREEQLNQFAVYFVSYAHKFSFFSIFYKVLLTIHGSTMTVRSLLSSCFCLLCLGAFTLKYPPFLINTISFTYLSTIIG